MAVSTFMIRQDRQGLAASLNRLGGLVADLPDHAPAWNDYAVGLLLRFSMGGTGLDLFTALEASAVAVELAPASDGAWFNHAMLLQQVGLRHSALDAWRQARSRADGPWRQEISERLDRLKSQKSREDLWLRRIAESRPPHLTVASEVEAFPWRSQKRLFEQILPGVAAEMLRSGGPSQSRSAAKDIARQLAELGAVHGRDVLDSWGETPDRRHLEAVMALGQGLVALEELDVGRGRELLRRALPILRDRKDPLRLSAELGLVVTDYFDDSEAALRATDSLCSGAAARYPSILGRALWLRGSLLGRHGNYLGSRAAYRRARRVLEPVYGAHPAAYLQVLEGEVSTLDGRLEESWQAFAAGLPSVLRVASRRRIHSALATVASALREAGLERAASRVSTEAVANAESWGSAYGRAASLRGLASAELRAGRWSLASELLERSRQATAAIADPLVAELSQADLSLDQAELLLSTGASREDLEHLREALGRSVTVFRRAGSVYDEVQGLRRLAEVNITLGGNGLQSLDRADALLAEVRPAPIDRPGALGPGLAQDVAALRARALLKAGEVGTALLAAERSRLLQSGFGAQPTADLIDGLKTLTAASDAVVLMLLGGPEILTWTVSPSGVSAVRSAVGSQHIGDLAQGLRGATPERRLDLMGQLSRLLLPADLPEVKRYLVVTDRSLAAVPFQALPHPATDQPLIDGGNVGRSPNLSWLVSQPARPVAGSYPLVVAAGSDGQVRLPAAVAEATLAAAGLPSSVRLDNPTPSEVLHHLQRARLFVFSGHLRADPLAPYRQELILGDHHRLSSGTILAQPLGGLELAVLSSCDSAAAGTGRFPGPSYADIFLLAGARSVIGTLWPIGDQSSLELMRDFWRNYHAGLSALDALGEAQRLARKRDPWGDKEPATWMAFRIEGALLKISSADLV